MKLYIKDFFWQLTQRAFEHEKSFFKLMLKFELIYIYAIKNGSKNCAYHRGVLFGQYR